MVICYTTAIVMLVVGIGFFTGKAVTYIKSYQDMEENEKNNIKIGALCKNISLLFFIAAAIFAAAGFSEVFRQDYFRWFMVCWFALGAADVVYIGKSKRFVHVYTIKKPFPVSSKKRR